MSRFTVDIGNTRIGAARVEANRLLDRFDGRPVDSGRDTEARVAEVFDWCMDQAALHGVEGLVISSVVPAQREILEALWRGHGQLGRLPLLVVSHEVPLPMRVRIAEPATVGADRYCNVAGAIALGHSHAIVVDLGTANTFDVLDDGAFVGGLIGPGAIIAHRALIASTAQLPQIRFSWPVEFVARTTADAILSGSFHQAVGGVLHVIARLRERLPGAAVLVTGGLAEVLGSELGDEVLHVPGLTHIGAAAIAECAPT